MTEKDTSSREPMLEMFIFETVQLIEQLEELLIEVEKSNHISPACINEIFRIMHTIKGAAAMMMYDNIARLSHALEDLFASIRAGREMIVDCVRLTDIALQSVDFIKAEITKLENGQEMDGRPDNLIRIIRQYLAAMPARPESARPDRPAEGHSAGRLALAAAAGSNLPRYTARIFFEDGCQMENMRAYTVIHSLQAHVQDLWYEPGDIMDNEQSSEVIRENGFVVFFTSEESPEMLYTCLEQTIFLERLEFEPVDRFPGEAAALEGAAGNQPEICQSAVRQQNIISVNINKLDQLMDLVSELVIAEAMVTRNPELTGLQLPLDNFFKSARRLNKLTAELQDMVLSIRMIPIAATFHKMQRIVRDMNRKLDKHVDLVLIGEETEVDKRIIDHLSDPLMHLIRNSLDHGIESSTERLAAGKSERGTLVLEARNSGGDVWISIKDDGRGLDKAKILNKASQQGLLAKNEDEYTEQEIFSFILRPGFSTRETVSEYSGRGVGLDVVRENIAKVGGTITLDSTAGRGTTITIRFR